MVPVIDLFREFFSLDGVIYLTLGLLHDRSPRISRNDCATLQVVKRKISELSLARIVGRATFLVDATVLATKSEFA